MADNPQRPYALTVNALIYRIAYPRLFRKSREFIFQPSWLQIWAVRQIEFRNH